jgi:protein TonB
MKYRIIIAAICAVSVHIALFSVNVGFLPHDTRIFPATNVMHMTFSSPKKETSESKTKKTRLKKKETKKQALFPEKASDKKTKDSKESDTLESISVFHEAKPLSIANTPPQYPRIAQLRSYQGTVVLRVLVNANGTVSKINVLKSSGYWILDKAALNAVKDWRFQPGTDGTKKIDMWVKQPIRFELK